MKHVLLVGNGFDIANGIPTKFTDFSSYLINKILIPDLINCVINHKESIYFSHQLFKNRNEHLYPFGYNTKYSLVGALSRIDDENMKASLLENKMKFLIFLNNKFLLSLFQEESEFWFDIESTYFRRIKAIRETSTSKKREIITLKNLNNDFTEIKLLLKEYLLGLDVKISSEVNFFIDKFRKDYASRNGELFVIDFNYTQALKTISLGRAYYDYVTIHGNLDEEIIFGWGNDKDTDYTEIKNTGIDEFLVNFKTHQYLLNRHYHTIHDVLISGSNLFQVHVLGHSLGLTDKSLLQEIFESKNCQKIHLYKRLDKYDSEIEYGQYQPAVRAEFTKLTMALSRIVDDMTARIKIKNFEESQYFPFNSATNF